MTGCFSFLKSFYEGLGGVLQKVERKFQIYAVFGKIPVSFKEREQLCTIQGLFLIPCDLG